MFYNNKQKTNYLTKRVESVLKIVQKSARAISKASIEMEDDIITRTCMEAKDAEKYIREIIQGTVNSVLVVLSLAEFMINATQETEEKAKTISQNVILRKEIIQTTTEATESAVCAMDISVRALDMVIDSMDMIAEASERMENAFVSVQLRKKKQTMHQDTERTPEYWIEYLKETEESNMIMKKGLEFVHKASDTIDMASNITEMATNAILETSEYMNKSDDMIAQLELLEKTKQNEDI
jgi:hypothetical protein